MVLRSWLGRLLVAPVALPHELGHALPAAAAGLPVRVTLIPEWEGDKRPLGRFNTTLTPSTPLWVIRAVAVAPTLLYVGVAALIRVTAAPTGPVAVGAVLCCAAWASPSAGDLAVARDPAGARAAGELLVTTTGSETVVADVATVAVTAAIGLILLG